MILFFVLDLFLLGEGLRVNSEFSELFLGLGVIDGLVFIVDVLSKCCERMMFNVLMVVIN